MPPEKKVKSKVRARKPSWKMKQRVYVWDAYLSIQGGVSVYFSVKQKASKEIRSASNLQTKQPYSLPLSFFLSPFFFLFLSLVIFSGRSQLPCHKVPQGTYGEVHLMRSENPWTRVTEKLRPAKNHVSWKQNLLNWVLKWDCSLGQ